MESLSTQSEEWTLYPGEIVYTSDVYPEGLTIHEYLALPKSARRHCDFRATVRDRDVRAAGRCARMTVHA